MRCFFVTCLTAPLLLSALPAQKKPFDPAGELEANVAELEEEKGKVDAALVEPLTDLGWLHLTGSLYPQATEALVRASQIVRRTPDTENFSVIGGLKSLGDELLAGGVYAEAMAVFREQLEVVKRYRRTENGEMANCLNYIVGTLHAPGKYSEAETLEILAEIHEALGEDAEAAEFAKRAEAIRGKAEKE